MSRSKAERFARLWTHNQADAEDVAQDARLRALELGAIDIEGTAASLAFNLARDKARAETALHRRQRAYAADAARGGSLRNAASETVQRVSSAGHEAKAQRCALRWAMLVELRLCGASLDEAMDIGRASQGVVSRATQRLYGHGLRKDTARKPGRPKGRKDRKPGNRIRFRRKRVAVGLATVRQ